MNLLLFFFVFFGQGFDVVLREWVGNDYEVVHDAGQDDEQTEDEIVYPELVEGGRRNVEERVLPSLQLGLSIFKRELPRPCA
ncbi:MAG: hypothetical protein OK438_03320 [Thaumarchaeota archaeon]|nr:hypothetical protein [Nitrososphaerota archaeon]